MLSDGLEGRLGNVSLCFVGERKGDHSGFPTTELGAETRWVFYNLRSSRRYVVVPSA